MEASHPSLHAMYERVEMALRERADMARDLALEIHKNPELRFEEVRASAAITARVERETGLTVERPLGGLATALRARAGRSEGTAPRVAILAEYDALPEIGHACGHNLIAAGATAAFVALSRSGVLDELGGAVDLVGTPAEEGGGGKILLLEAGVFEGLSAAMMFHPFDRDLVAHPTLANMWVTFEYAGKSSHAAIAPWSGASALTACMQTFHLIDAQRVHFRDGVRVHGYITDGGRAANIIPARAASEFSVRATNVTELERVRAIVERCAKGAALACGVEVTITPRRGYRDVRSNLALAQRFAKHITRPGRAVRDADPDAGTGSTDMGDVSHAVPSIHPWVAICECGEAQCHEQKFAGFAASERGLASMMEAARAMAFSAVDVLADSALRAEIRREFEGR